MAANKPDAKTAVFMDSANDGEFDELKSIYQEATQEEKKSFLTYKNVSMQSSALHLAANNGNSDIVEFICDCINDEFPSLKDMMINLENKFKFTPLLSVCFRGYLTKGTKKDADQDRIRIVRCLIKNGARASYVTSDTKLSALHWAAYNKDYAVVKELLLAGAPWGQFSAM